MDRSGDRRRPGVGIVVFVLCAVSFGATDIGVSGRPGGVFHTPDRSCCGAALCSFGAALGDPQVFFPPIGLAAGLFFPGYYVTGNRKMGTDVRVAPILIGVGLTGAIVSPLIVAKLNGNPGDRGFFWLIGGLACALAFAALTRLRDMNR